MRDMDSSMITIEEMNEAYLDYGITAVCHDGNIINLGQEKTDCSNSRKNRIDFI